MKTRHIAPILLACLLGSAPMKAQNYDETKVPLYTLPDLLTAEDGTPVTTARQWKKQQRPHLLELLATHGYGHTPTQKTDVTHEVVYENKQALGGRATQQQVRFTFSGEGKTIQALLLVYSRVTTAPARMKTSSTRPILSSSPTARTPFWYAATKHRAGQSLSS